MPEGSARLAEGNPTAAQEEFHRALRLKPSLAEAHLGLGLALGQSAELEAAAAEFRAAIRLRPSYAEAHKRLGVTLRRLGDPKAALAEFQDAVHADGKDPEAWYNLGLARKSGGDAAGAIEAFRQAIAIKPDFEKAHYNLGIALRSAGRGEASRKELEEVRGLHEFRGKLAESKALITRGVEALEHDNDGEALEPVRASFEREPFAGDRLALSGGRLRSQRATGRRR